MIKEEKLRSEILGLLVGCPFSLRLDKCPFVELDILELQEKYNWMIESSVEELDMLIKEHNRCFFDRR